MAELSIAMQKMQQCSINTSVLEEKQDDVRIIYDDRLSIPIATNRDVKQKIDVLKSAGLYGLH